MHKYAYINLSPVVSGLLSLCLLAFVLFVLCRFTVDSGYSFGIFNVFSNIREIKILITYFKGD